MKNITYKILKIVIVMGILSSVFQRKVKTDGVFKKIEKLYKITVIPENSEPHTNTEIVETRVTDLGKKIDVIKIIKDYDPENIFI